MTRFARAGFAFACCLASWPALLRGEPSGPAIQPGAPVDYGPLAFNPDRWAKKKLSTQMIPWEGRNLVFFTQVRDLDAAAVRRFVERLDAGWDLYAGLTGRRPSPFKQWNGKASIAAVPDAGLSCGVGCGYVGATGIELGKFYDDDYPMVTRATNDYPHYAFYEMGRNFYTFGDRHSLFVTGYAVFMRYVCMDALRCGDPDRRTRETIEKAENLLANTPGLGFLKAFTTLDGLDEKAHRLQDDKGRPLAPSDQPVLYASAMMKLHRECGGDAWLKRFYAALADCPAVKPDSKEAAVRQALNWYVSASIAAGRDLSPLFVDRWRLPLPGETRRLAASLPWGAPAPAPSARVRQLSDGLASPPAGVRK